MLLFGYLHMLRITLHRIAGFMALAASFGGVLAGAACGGKVIELTPDASTRPPPSPRPPQPGPTPVPPPDPTSVPPSVPDASVPDVAPASDHAKIIFVHAAPAIPAWRICLASGQAWDGSDRAMAPLPALPHRASAGRPYPGLFPGTGGPMPDIVDLEGLALTPYVILAKSIAAETGDLPNEKTCVDLLGPRGLGIADSPPGALTAGADFVALKTIPSHTFAHRTTFLLSLLGSMQNASIGIAALDTTTPVPGGDFAVQLAHRSAALEESRAPGGVRPDISYANATVIGVASSDVHFSPSAVTPAETVITSPSNATLDAVWHGPDGGARMLSETFDAIERHTTGSTGGPSMFATGRTYTFVLLGDPEAPSAALQDGGVNPSFDGRGLHFLAFPNDIAAPTLN
jgi:hypothetical protein